MELHQYQRSFLPLLIVIGLLLFAGVAVAGYFLFIRQAPRHPDRVVVVVSGAGANAAELRQKLADALSEQGYQTIPKAADDESPEELEDPISGEPSPEEAVAAAERVDAGHVVHVTVRVVGDYAPLVKGAAALHAEAVGQAYSVETGDALGEAHSIEFAVEDSSRELALNAMTKPFVDALTPGLLEDLIRSPGMETLLADDQGLEGAIHASRFRETKAGLRVRGQRQQVFDESCQKEDAAIAALARGKPAVRCISGGCDEEYLSGISPDGKTLLVRAESGRPIYSFARDTKLYRFEVPDRLLLVDVASGQRKPLALSPNLYTAPTLSENGKVAAFIEQANRHYGVVAVDTATGQRSVVHAVQAPEVLQEVQLSADGQQAMFLVRKTRSGPGALLVAPTTAGAQPAALAPMPRQARWVNVPPAKGQPPRPMVAVLGNLMVMVPLVAPGVKFAKGSDPVHPRYPDHVAIANPATGKMVAVFSVGQRRIDHLVGEHAGVLYFIYLDDNGCGLGRYDINADQVSRVGLEICVEHVRVGSGGKLVGELVPLRDKAGPKQKELVQIDPTSGKHTVLTSSPEREAYPRAAPAGGRIAFERRGSSPYRGFPRVAVCYLDP